MLWLELVRVELSLLDWGQKEQDLPHTPPPWFLNCNHKTCTWLLCTCMALCPHKSTDSGARSHTETRYSRYISLHPWNAYSYMLDAINLSSLSSRLSRNFFPSITNPASCLHHLLPPPRSNAVTSRLSSYEIYPRPSTHTKQYCSLVQ